MQHYIAIVHKEKTSDFGVSFPDFLGCITAGKTLEEARIMAKEALEFHIEGLQEDGMALPTPSTLDAIRAQGLEGDLFFEVGISPPMNEKSLRVNISLPETLLREIDSYAANRGLTRSGFLARAAKTVFENATMK